jgi:hypothetical protein
LKKKQMKRYLFILMMTLSSWATFGQTTTTTKSERTGFSIHETETSYQVKADFSAERSKRFFDVLKTYLGAPAHINDKTTFWEGANYTAMFTTQSFKASLDKEKASAKQLTSFKKLTKELQAALGQAKTPTPPTSPSN